VIPTLLARNLFAGIPRVSAVIRVRASNAHNVAGVIAIVVETAAAIVAEVRAVPKGVLIAAGTEVQTEVQTAAETVAAGVSNAAQADRTVVIKVDTPHSAVRNSFPKCSRLGRM
jgi:hypothetical protein